MPLYTETTPCNCLKSSFNFKICWILLWTGLTLPYKIPANNFHGKHTVLKVFNSTLTKNVDPTLIFMQYFSDYIHVKHLRTEQNTEYQALVWVKVHSKEVFSWRQKIPARCSSAQVLGFCNRTMRIYILLCLIERSRPSAFISFHIFVFLFILFK